MAARITSRAFSHHKELHRTFRQLFSKSSHLLHRFEGAAFHCGCHRLKNRKDTLSSVIQPLTVKPVKKSADDINVGEELTGTLRKEKVLIILSQFYKRENVKKLAFENGLDTRMYHQAYISFRKFCIESTQLPVDLHITLSDILQGSGNVDDLFPYYLDHALEIYPHLECMEDLKKISDLRLPANWYPEARSIQRKFIFHAGPTNSGKTYQALERFMTAKSGVYCGPLKLLAAEVYQKAKERETACDLVTGEERRFANEDGSQSNHVACTVEMASITTPYEVAVVDEIQTIRDAQRGWAWTRAILGLYAEEIHVCGEASAIDLIKELALSTGEEVEVRRYKRLTNLAYLDHAVEKFENVQPGDCIVCFNKNDIYYATKQLELLNMECAVIYGSLPPSTKLAQAAKFNDPNSPCNVMVATDAIGMGLNLSIKRVIFYSIMKPMLNEKGDIEMNLISTSQALQIGGRAGRFRTIYENGEVTTFHGRDLPILKDILAEPIEPIMVAGLHPTADQIELFAYHLPKATLSNLIDIFQTSCSLDQDSFFMCKQDDFKFLADTIEHVPLSLRVRYVFCCAPLNVKQPFAIAMFLKFARRFSRNHPLTFDWLCGHLGWPLKPPETLVELVHLENVFDVMDLYLWLSYRFQDLFPDVTMIREVQEELDQIIQQGVRNIVDLVKNQEKYNRMEMDNEDDFVIKTQEQRLDTRRPLLRGLQRKEREEKEARSDRKIVNTKLGQRLVDSGVVSQNMLKKLKRELFLEIQKQQEDSEFKDSLKNSFTSSDSEDDGDNEDDPTFR